MTDREQYEAERHDYYKREWCKLARECDWLIRALLSNHDTVMAFAVGTNSEELERGVFESSLSRMRQAESMMRDVRSGSA